MFKYKLDGIQIWIIILLLIFAYASLAAPYRMNADKVTLQYGATSLLRWFILGYVIRICLHVFGMILNYPKVHLIAISLGLFLDIYLSFFLGEENSTAIWWGLLLYLFSYILVIGIILVDRILYRVERR